MFALSNGHIGWRGNLDEGEPHGLPGTYLNGVYELRPLPYAEAGYGYPESGQTVINVTNGKIIRLLVDDEPFDLRYGQLRRPRAARSTSAPGVLERACRVDVAGRVGRSGSARPGWSRFTQRAIAAICYEVEPSDGPARVVVQSELVANEQLPALGERPAGRGRARVAAGARGAHRRDTAAELVHRTRRSGLRVAAADGPRRRRARPDTTCCRESDAGPRPGHRHRRPGAGAAAARWSSSSPTAGRRRAPGPRCATRSRRRSRRRGTRGWDGLLAEQRAYLDDFWARADVEVDGDAEIQQAVRFALFHVLQAGARAERRAIPAKGLTGPGYDGHAFWDTETFVLPVLTYTAPDAVADALRWRHAHAARRPRARRASSACDGAAFPWRTIEGEECSALLAGRHRRLPRQRRHRRRRRPLRRRHRRRRTSNATPASSCSWRPPGCGARSATTTPTAHFRIDGVTGPDEYSAIADNNVYTNLMAQREPAAPPPTRRTPSATGPRELGVDDEEMRRLAGRRRGHAHPLRRRTRRAPAGARASPATSAGTSPAPAPDQYPLLLHFPYFDLYRKQVVKQADLVLAMHLRGDAFTDEQKARNFAYYEPLTVRDSSLSACSQAVIAAEVGHLDLAYDYLGEAALMDLDDLEHNTRDGLHIASLAGTGSRWSPASAACATTTASMRFAPRLPEGSAGSAFTIAVRGDGCGSRRPGGEAAYLLLDGPPLEIVHHGQALLVTPAKRLSPPDPARTGANQPTQPPGRAPARRRPQPSAT